MMAVLSGDRLTAVSLSWEAAGEVGWVDALIHEQIGLAEIHVQIDLASDLVGMSPDGG